MRINAAQVRGSEHLGCFDRIVLGDSEVQEHASAKFAQDLDRKSLCFNVAHIDRSSSRSCANRSEEHTSELQSQSNLVCRLLLEKTNLRAPSPPTPSAPRGAKSARRSPLQPLTSRTMRGWPAREAGGPRPRLLTFLPFRTRPPPP